MKDNLETRVSLLEKRVNYFYEHYANKDCKQLWDFLLKDFRAKVYPNEEKKLCFDWHTKELVEEESNDEPKRPKVYISGPVTGRDMTECKVDFNSAELWLTGLGYDVVNPLSYDVIENGSWEEYMRRDLKLLCDCDYIYLLDGWESSRGARIEYNVAFDLGIIPLTLAENGKVI